MFVYTKVILEVHSITFYLRLGNNKMHLFVIKMGENVLS